MFLAFSRGEGGGKEEPPQNSPVFPFFRRCFQLLMFSCQTQVGAGASLTPGWAKAAFGDPPR